MYKKEQQYQHFDINSWGSHITSKINSHDASPHKLNLK